MDSSCFTADTLARYGILACDGQIDQECLPLWEVLSRCDGIDPIACCSGHAVYPMSFWFGVTRLEALTPILAVWTSPPYCFAWQCCVTAQGTWAAIAQRLSLLTKEMV